MTLLAKAERIKLGRVLGVAAAELEYLELLSVAEMRGLRERVSATLFDRHRALFQRAVGPARILPARLNARLSEKVFGPFLSARLSSVMPADKAVDVARHLTPDFLAEICLAMDPRRSRAVVEVMPAEVVVAAARELVRREEYIVMGQFVDALPEGSIRAVIGILDDAQLLEIGFYVEQPARLDQLIAALPDPRVDGMLRLVARGTAEQQAAGLVVLSQLSAAQQRRFGDRLKALSLDGTFRELARREEAAELVPRVLGA
ncbi:MAG TPA: hypothetical protein VM369_03555 [Candidatus Binatia bacterium]|nr:hypothetical protein [Candidatus Binatia bacterium]